MATKTEKYELRKKEENDFYNIEDFNDNMDKLETALTEFDDSGSADGITSFTEMITKFVTGNKLAVTLRNLKAGLQFVLHTGSIVNNCVTDNPKLPLSAAQGKVLMDYFNQLNSDLDLKLNNTSIFVGNGEDFGQAIKKADIVKLNKVGFFICNNPSNSPLGNGFIILAHNSAYWSNHPTYIKADGSSISCGTLNCSDYTHITKD